MNESILIKCVMKDMKIHKFPFSIISAGHAARITITIQNKIKQTIKLSEYIVPISIFYIPIVWNVNFCCLTSTSIIKIFGPVDSPVNCWYIFRQS